MGKINYFSGCGQFKIGVVCLMSHNIGNNLTNFALYQFLKDNNFFARLIDIPENSGLSVSDRFFLFKKNPFPKDDLPIKAREKEELEALNRDYDMFLVGSDQIFRTLFIKRTGFRICLDWVASSKYKASYAASFGVDTFEDDRIRRKTWFYLSRFQRISVREGSGVDILRQQFKLAGEWVLDPVFLCDRKHYEEMSHIGEERLPKGKYISAYLLSLTDMGEKIITEVSRACGIKENVAILASQLKDEKRYLGSANTMPLAKIEEWLAMIKNSEYVVTDSFHGLCFALIFQKEFCIVFDRDSWRGLARMESILSLLGLRERMVLEEEDIQRVLSCGRIDYGKVNEVLDRDKARSSGWLLETIEMGMHFKPERNKDMQLIAWGAGDCFKRNYEKMREVCPVQYVCDSNPKKWGDILEGEVKCISPEELGRMENVFVIITVDSPGLSLQIVNSLLDMGIHNLDHIENWLA